MRHHDRNKKQERDTKSYYLEDFRQINTFILDVDGVLTNSELIVLENGHLLRKMSTRDGFAIKEAVFHGFDVFVITGGKSTGVIQRLRNLGVKEVFSGVDNKIDAFDELIYTYNLNEEEILYMGDDMPDYEVMRKVFMPTCPKDAAPEIKYLCKYISPFKGGEGCVRDVIEKVLKLNGKWIDPSMFDPPGLESL